MVEIITLKHMKKILTTLAITFVIASISANLYFLISNSSNRIQKSVSQVSENPTKESNSKDSFILVTNLKTLTFNGETYFTDIFQNPIASIRRIQEILEPNQVSNLYSSFNPNNPDSIFISAHSFKKRDNSQEDFGPGDYLNENFIYEYNFKENRIIQLIYSEIQELSLVETETAEQSSTGLASLEFTEMPKIYRLVGIQDNKLVFHMDFVDNSPNPCINIFDEQGQFAFLDIQNTSSGFQNYQLPNHLNLSAANINLKREACLSEFNWNES
jgi:hypothetical protein